MMRFLLVLSVIFLGPSLAWAQRIKLDNTELKEKPPASTEVIEIEVIIGAWSATAEKDAKTAELREVDVKTLEKSGDLSVHQRIKLTALNELRAQVQFSERRPIVTSVAQTVGGRTQRTVNYQNLGTMIAATPRVDGDRILLELSVEHSGISEGAGVALVSDADPEKERAPAISSMTVKTTVSIREGEAVILGGASTRDAASSSGEIIIVSAKLK